MKVLIATYSRSGKTRGVAEELAQIIKEADMYQIAVAPGTFNRDRYQTDKIATAQIQHQQYPELINPLPAIDQYDLILVGSPVWRGAPATPVHTFLKQIQTFKGKVASFYTDMGKVGSNEENFRKWAGKLKVLPAHEGENNLAGWVKTLIIEGGSE